MELHGFDGEVFLYSVHTIKMPISNTGPQCVMESRADHIWEITVLYYHRIRVNFPYPFLGIVFIVNFHVLKRQISIKIVQLLPFSPLYGKLPNIHLINIFYIFLNKTFISFPKHYSDNF